MRLATLRRGVAGARRHPGVVWLFYLAALLPALLTLSLLAADVGEPLSQSLGAERLLSGDWLAVAAELGVSDDTAFDVVAGGLLWRFLLVVLLQVLLAAGAVEALLERRGGARHPFLYGIGEHGWPFLRAALWFGLSLLPVVLLTGLVAAGGARLGRELQNGWWGLSATWLSWLLLLVGYTVLDAAYDLARVSLARHGGRRTFAATRRALGFVLRQPRLFLSLYWPLTVGMLLLPIVYLLLRGAWRVDGGFELALLLLLQQVVFIAQAILKTALWSGEIVYFRAAGEPDWGRRPGPPSTSRPQEPRPLPRHDETLVDVPRPLPRREGGSVGG